MTLTYLLLLLLLLLLLVLNKRLAAFAPHITVVDWANGAYDYKDV